MILRARGVPSGASLFSFFRLVKLLQVADPVVDDLDLLLHHRDPFGEVVVFPDLPGQLLDLGVRHRLMLVV